MCGGIVVVVVGVVFVRTQVTGFMSDALLEDQSACVVVWCAAGQ